MASGNNFSSSLCPRYYDFARFSKLWRKLHTPKTPELNPLYVKVNLDTIYESDFRFYHGVPHINQGLEEFDQVKHLLENPNELEIGWYFHDAVYDTKTKNNEEKSAEFLSCLLDKSGVLADKIMRTSRIIRVTDHKTPPENLDEEVIVDIDLSIFGQSKEKYLWYSEEIRKEYLWVPEEQFKQGRRLILENFLGRDRIYYTSHFRDKYESQARANLKSEIKRLSA